LLAAVITALAVLPIAIAGASGQNATASAKSNVTKALARQVRALKKQTAALTASSEALAARVATLEKKPSPVPVSPQPSPQPSPPPTLPTSLPPNGPAGGALTGTFPNPQLAPNSVNSSVIADNAISTSDFLAGAVTARTLGPVHEVEGESAVLKGGEATKTLLATCPTGQRLLSGGQDWEFVNGDGMDTVSSEPVEALPATSWRIKVRIVASNVVTQKVTAKALCLF
jgi:hypothetical protein